MVTPQSSTIADDARSVCVIGAGLAGLALAIRLQAAGYRTTLVEARSAVGGLLRRIECDGFNFQEGPAHISDPEPLRELWRITGDDGEADLRLVPVEPATRFLWSDGTSFDAAGDPAELARQVARLAPGDVGAVEDWRAWAALTRARVWPALAEGLPSTFTQWRIAAEGALATRAWQSATGLVDRLFRENHLRQAFTHGALLSGGNPIVSGAATLAGQHVPGSGPAYWPLGGMARLAETLADRFMSLGGSVRLHDPVARIETVGNRVTKVETLSGWHQPFDAVASTADTFHTYRNLLKSDAHGAKESSRIARKPYSPSALTVHFALAGSWPGIAHNTVLVGPRFEALFGDIFDAGVLPRDMLIWLCHPTVTDPDLAAGGHSVLRATIPVAHLGKLPIDWGAVGPVIAERILAEVGRRLVPDIEDRILARHVTTPRDLALDLGLHLGSGWSLAARGRSGLALRLGHKDRRIPNLFLAGAATWPGAGVAGVLAGAKACAERIKGTLT